MASVEVSIGFSVFWSTQPPGATVQRLPHGLSILVGIHGFRRASTAAVLVLRNIHHLRWAFDGPQNVSCPLSNQENGGWIYSEDDLVKMIPFRGPIATQCFLAPEWDPKNTQFPCTFQATKWGFNTSWQPGHCESGFGPKTIRTSWSPMNMAQTWGF